jgi:hypothetical protein
MVVDDASREIGEECDAREKPASRPGFVLARVSAGPGEARLPLSGSSCAPSCHRDGGRCSYRQSTRGTPGPADAPNVPIAMARGEAQRGQKRSLRLSLVHSDVEPTLGCRLRWIRGREVTRHGRCRAPGFGQWGQLGRTWSSSSTIGAGGAMLNSVMVGALAARMHRLSSEVPVLGIHEAERVGRVPAQVLVDQSSGKAAVRADQCWFKDEG